MRVYGVDFTSAPKPRKPITAAQGHLEGNILTVERIEAIELFESFEEFLHRPGPWISGFDFPFGLPRDALVAFRWPDTWEDMVRHCARLGRSRFADRLNRDRISRPPGKRYRYRSGDRIAGSSPAVRLHQVPVGYMFFEGAQRLARSGVNIPVLRENDSNRIALEAYPGYLTKTQLRIASYKSDEHRKQTPQRERNRKLIVERICAGIPLGIQLNAPRSLARSLVDDATGDRLDSVICALQAAWGWKNRENRFGLPGNIDAVEGWIVTVPGA
jgi:hypothetical protein